jgi:hypothetical protein
MAKDPAVLWYWSDWNSGTALLSRHLKGCYMDLMHAQFNHGHLSLEEIKTVLGSDFGNSWPALQKKFSADPAGNFFNERLEQEQDKRKNWVQSRRNNLNKPHKEVHMEQHMAGHMENVNENRNKNKEDLKELFFHFFENPDFNTTWKDFHEMRKKQKKGMTAKAEKLILNKLETLSSGNVDVAVKILEKSIERGWLGVFPLEEDKKQVVQGQPKSHVMKRFEENEELKKHNELLYGDN